jgi:hypothetical protein
MGRYEMTQPVLSGERLLACTDCGALIADSMVSTHDRFHSILSSHAWTLAVLKTSHIGAGVHERYDVVERIDSRKFDNWSADALAQVISEMGDGS